jgi:non-haem Fe2+, alpha-ketoglutarate-dependent halogenase
MSNFLSPDKVEKYRRDGYVCPVPALSFEEAGAIRRKLEEFERASGMKAGNVVRSKGHLKLMFIYNSVFNAQILDAVESVLGPNIMCWGASLFVKEPRDPGYVAWHQDSYYWGLEPDDVVTTWVALAPSTLENGAMRVIPGSHRGTELPHAASAPGSANILLAAEEIAVEVDEAEAVDFVLAQGEMSMHHVKLTHGSPPNRSDSRRYGLAIRYVAPHVRQKGDRNAATLVRGVDTFGYFDREPVPTRDMDPAILEYVDRPMAARVKQSTAA